MQLCNLLQNPSQMIPLHPVLLLSDVSVLKFECTALRDVAIGDAFNREAFQTKMSGQKSRAIKDFSQSPVILTY